MDIRSRLTRLLISLGLLGLLTACGINNSPANFSGTQSLNHDYDSPIVLNVTTTNGAISVTAAQQKEIAIVAKFRTISQERLDNSSVRVTNDANGNLMIDVNWADGKRENNESVSFDIALPATAGLRLRTNNGRLSSHNLSGSADLKTSNGTIEVQRHQGDLKSHTSNGRITLSDIDGNIDASTSNGRITIVNATAEVKAKTSNQSIKIQLADGASGPITANTSNGSVDFTLSEAFRGHLAMRTSNGAIRLEDLGAVQVVRLDKNKAELKFGEGGSHSTIKTSNGSIRLHPAPKPQ
ncbi:hypothetical protein [Ferrimonas pelagia]|uniref:Adhesin domain-containing protein n=1 Tax=Ferrimonas pelagia TaxID=1177826 RepID=A0ABP9EMD3_9GAMM